VSSKTSVRVIYTLDHPQKCVAKTEKSISVLSMHFHIVKMYTDKEANKNVQNIFLSMCDVKVSLTFTSLQLVLF
jgi:hypothetical protein